MDHLSFLYGVWSEILLHYKYQKLHAQGLSVLQYIVQITQCTVCHYHLRHCSGDNGNDHMTFSVVLPGCGGGTGEVGSDLKHQDGRDGEIPESHPPRRPGQETQAVPEQRWGNATSL